MDDLVMFVLIGAMFAATFALLFLVERLMTEEKAK